MRAQSATVVRLLRATFFSIIITSVACWMSDWETVGTGVLAGLFAVPAGAVFVIVEAVRPGDRILKYAGFLASWLLLFTFVIVGHSSSEGSDMTSFVGKAALIALLCTQVVLAGENTQHRPS